MHRESLSFASMVVLANSILRNPALSSHSYPVLTLKYFKERILDQIAPEDIEKFKAYRRRQKNPQTKTYLKSSTIKRDLACLKALYNYHIRCDVRIDNPVKKVKFLEEEQEMYVLSYQEQNRLFVYSMPEYEGVSAKRRDERLAFKPLDTREVLYGRALLDFIARELFVARNSDDEGLFTEVHAKWLMTAREDLRDKTPREILLAKQGFIDFDLHSRSLQWSFTGACPPPLPRSSNAYARAGFGTHEIVVYYELVRCLLAECFARLRAEKEFSLNATVEHLEQLKAAWLAAPNRDFSGRTPAHIIESERQRVNLTMSATEYVIDEDCDFCQALAADFDTPTFWHLDGCNMDDRFEFSFHKTRAEFEAERKQWEEFNQEFDRDWKEGKYDKLSDEAPIWFDDDENLIQ